MDGSNVLDWFAICAAIPPPSIMHFESLFSVRWQAITGDCFSFVAHAGRHSAPFFFLESSVLFFDLTDAQSLKASMI